MRKFTLAFLLLGSIFISLSELANASMVTIDFEDAPTSLFDNDHYEQLNYLNNNYVNDQSKSDLTISVFNDTEPTTPKKFDIFESPGTELFHTTNNNPSDKDSVLTYYHKNSTNNSPAPLLKYRVTFDTSQIHVTDFSMCLKKVNGSVPDTSVFLNTYIVGKTTPISSSINFNSYGINFFHTSLSFSVSSPTEIISHIEFWDYAKYLPPQNTSIVSTADNTQYNGTIYYDDIMYNYTESSSIPEPTTILLLGTSLAGIFATRKMRLDSNQL